MVELSVRTMGPITELEFRPRFRFISPLSVEEIRERLQDAIASRNPFGLRLSGNGSHLVLAFPPNVLRAWTPQMDVDLETMGISTRVRCLIGPSPSIWMLFMGGYIFCVVSALLGLSIGVGQQVVGATPWGYWLVAPTPFLALVLWALARIGRNRARAQSRMLKGFVDRALDCDCFAMAEHV
jgi:hypothetical protein